MAFIFRSHIASPLQNLPALRTANLEQFAVHMDYVLAARTFMQVINVLRHQ